MPEHGIPSPEPIKEITDKFTNFIQWLAELILARNWIALLVLSVVIGWFFLRPESGLFLTLLSIEAPGWYAHAFWLAIVAGILSAVVIAIRTAPRPLKPGVEDPANRKAIKGLRPFSAEDADIFAKLQRNQSIQDCLESIANQDFHLGILVGESGSGKTSFLQAGIIPRLSASDSPLRAVYVKFSDRPPISTIRGTLTTQLSIPAEQVEHVEFLKILKSATEAAGKPIVLLFDQFEQFFLHHPKKDERAPFIQALTQWYEMSSSLPVKILVSIRAEFHYELIPLQQALGYTIRTYHTFPLEKFNPEEATAVLQVLADSESISFDSRFVSDVIQTDLTGIDGKVSPVDVQILAEIVRKQRISEQRQFSREAFQKLGGIEGLLNRYLENTLASLKIQGHTSLYQTVLQVLLALTNYNHNLRDNLLTLQELQNKLTGIATPREVFTAVNWLTSSDVRLVTPIEHQEQIRYELAHERIIPALLNLTGNELKEVEQAKQLLERRTQEWIGNQRHPRYLLNWSELRLIRTYKNQLKVGSDKYRRAKEQLLQKSWKRVQIGLWSLALVILLILTGFLAWLSPPIQYRYAILKLTETSQNIRHWTRSDAVLALAKNTKWDQALVVARSMQKDPYNTAKAFNNMASVAIVLDDYSRAKDLLEKASANASTIQNITQKVYVLSSIAACNSVFRDRKSTEIILEEINSLISENTKTLSNRSIPITASVYSSCTMSENIEKIYLIEQLQKLTAPLQDTSDSFFNKTLINTDKANDLISNAIFYIEANKLAAARNLIEQVWPLLEGILDSYHQVEILSRLSTVYSEKLDEETAAELLGRVEKVAEEMAYSDKVKVLISVVENYHKLGKINRVSETIEKIEQEIEEYSLNPRRSSSGPDGSVTTILNSPLFPRIEKIKVASLYANIGRIEEALKILEEETKIAKNTQDESNKLQLLVEISDGYGSLDDSSISSIGLDEIKAILSTIQHTPEFYRSVSKSDVFDAIARSYIRLNKLDEAGEILEQAGNQSEEIQDSNTRSEKLSEIVQTWCLLAENYYQKDRPRKAREALDRALENTQPIQDFFGEQGNEKSIALAAIASVWVHHENWQQVNSLVKQCASNDCQVSTWTAALTTAAEQHYPELIGYKEPGYGEIGFAL
jgi:tetratricopeptide (TPR) repeat protein